jgi:hypothetical protein
MSVDCLLGEGCLINLSLPPQRVGPSVLPIGRSAPHYDTRHTYLVMREKAKWGLQFLSYNIALKVEQNPYIYRWSGFVDKFDECKNVLLILLSDLWHLFT